MEVFSFRFRRRDFSQHLSYSTGIHEQGGGRRVAQKLHAAGELVVHGSLLFPQFGIPYSTFEAFWDLHFGGYLPFLYKRQGPSAAAIADAFVATTGQVDFTATRRYVHTTTVVVKKATVTQTLGVHYTLQNGSGGAYVLGISPRLVVHFLAAPGNGVAVTVDYEYYVPVRFEGDDLPDDPEMHAGGRGGAKVADRAVKVRMRETGAGSSYADAPNVL